jgi:hypothetical protein
MRVRYGRHWNGATGRRAGALGRVRVTIVLDPLRRVAWHDAGARFIGAAAAEGPADAVS